jgi:hypothetical protein
LRILDPACGSGSFLLGAYEFLLDWHLKWYLAEQKRTDAIPQSPPADGVRKKKGDPQAIHETKRGWLLTTTEKKRILLNNIYGVDIDAQAVEVTKLSLLLKVLENENQDSLKNQMKFWGERALPDLADNIKCGNSLVASSYFTPLRKAAIDEATMHRINPFDWKREFPEPAARGGFDCVIGNPPYIRIQTMTDWAPDEVEIYKELFETARVGSYDLYVVFVERGLELLSPTGQLGFILPSKFFVTDYGEPLRRVISESRALREVVDFGHAQIFRGATNYTCLLFLTRQPVAQIEYSRVTAPSAAAVGSLKPRLVESEALSGEPWVFSEGAELALAKKLAAVSVKLGELPTRIARGSSTGCDDVFMLRRRGASYLTRGGERVEIERGIMKVPVYATDFGRYRFAPAAEEEVIVPYNISRFGYELKSQEVLRQEFPKTFRYLSQHRAELERRKQFSEWYGFSAPRSLEIHESADFLVPLLANRGSFCRLPARQSGICMMASGGFSLTVDPRCRLAREYILGLLNSRLLFWRLKSISNVFRGGWVTCTKQYVKTLPIRVLDLSKAAEREHHDRIVALVSRLLALHETAGVGIDRSPNEQERVHRETQELDAQLDQLVYQAYGMTKVEVSIVEAGLNS